jgi:hypothetical protein
MTRQAPQTMRLVVRSLDDGSRETITVTPSHPFLRPDNENGRGILEAVKLDPFGDWSAVKNLKPGDELLSALGHHLVVDAVDLDSTPALVYDLEVEGLHSFAVGEHGAWGHNAVIIQQNGIQTTWNPRDHAPPHVHVEQNGKTLTRIGQNCKPILNDPPLTGIAKEVVENNKKLIRNFVRDMMREFAKNR